MANPNDGTQLGTGEVITDEYVDPTTGGRFDPNLPRTGYKLPRSKIAVGAYGVDGGDVSVDQPLNVQTRIERQLQETSSLSARETALFNARGRYAETVTLADARGSSLTTRGQR